MKIASPRYAGRISPRFGFTQDVLISDVEEARIRFREVLFLDRHLPQEIPSILSKKGVEVVLTGGINLHFHDLFKIHGIEVIWGLIGTPEEALRAYFTGEIASGMGRCPHRTLRHRGGSFWS